MGDLIDTTEMYLRTIYELEEEGIVPLRARIAERLHQSGPTVSQTVARMERDNLVHVLGDRHLGLTDEGRMRATRVMRKHRLAERLLIDVIGLDWEKVHDEACRWEHVISEDVERRLVDLLNAPTLSPYGNQFRARGTRREHRHRAVPGWERAAAGRCQQLHVAHRVVIERMSEEIQKDVEMMGTLRKAGIQPGAVVSAELGPGCQADGRQFASASARSIAKHPPTCSCRACNGTARRFRGEQRGQLAGVPCEFHRERAGIAEAVLSRLSLETIRRTAGWPERCPRTRAQCLISRVDQVPCHASSPFRDVLSSV